MRPPLLVALFLCFTQFETLAQTDITSTYLSNAGFNTNCNYSVAGTDTISSTAPPTADSVEGWHLISATGWGVSSTFEYGWNGVFNGVTIPTAGADGANGAGQGAIGISSGWSGEMVYMQPVTLPAGFYSIEIVSTFLGSNTILANLTGWQGNDSTSVFSDFIKSSRIGVWDTTTLTFKLPVQTSGRIQVGIAAANSGTGSNAKVFTDNIKLMSLPVTKDELQTLVDSANVIYDNPKPVPSGSTAYADLKTAIDAAQAVLDNGSATAGDIFNSEDSIKLTIKAVYKAIYTVAVTPVNNYTDTLTTLSDSIKLTGSGQLTLTSPTNPIYNGTIDLASTDSWVYFQDMRPSEVVSGPLTYMKVNSDDPVINGNIRLVQYDSGTMVVAQTPAYEPLTVFMEENFSGDSMKLGLYTYYRPAALGVFNDSVKSFVLKRGYMATFAKDSLGTGYSKVFIADQGDLSINELPAELSNETSFIRVFPWRWVAKKGKAGNAPDTLRCSWYYDWGQGPETSLNTEYVPMQWGWDDSPSYTNLNTQKGYTHALAFNEPDHTDQANMSVEEAIALWPKLLESGLRLGSPAPSDGGRQWLYDFIKRADELNYRVDFVAIHWYWGGSDAAGFYGFLKDVYDHTHRPIWITEWNNGANWTCCLPTYEEEKQKLKEMFYMLDTTSFVERHALYEWVQDERMLILADTLTPAGTMFRHYNSGMAFRQSGAYSQPFHQLAGKATDLSPIDSDTVTVTRIAGEPDSLMLSWTAGNMAQKHKVYLDGQKYPADGLRVPSTIRATLNLDQTSYALMNPQNGYKYMWQVNEVYSDGVNEIENFGDIMTFTVVVVTKNPPPAEVLGFDSPDRGISIYPQPVTDVLMFKGLKKDENVRILDLNGKPVFYGKTEGNQLNISNLSEGLYIMNIDGYNKIKILKE